MFRDRRPRRSGSCFIRLVEVRDHPSVIAVAATRLSLVWVLLLIVGAYGAVLGWRGGAFVMLAAVCGNVGGHLLIGITEYRRIMRRSWPKALPLDDEDEW
jgi:hypothetical protein